MSLRNPVKYPVKYYSWQDDQAPQLSNADGVIKTILKACLVTGYGSKAGAGWAALFEDDYRIVLRRPLRTGNPPDIKIENGVINGTASHRIVGQDNPTGLDDTTELSAVNLLGRESQNNAEWHCFVTDFGFLLFYQAGEYNYSDFNSRYLLFVGGAKKTLDSSDDLFFVFGQNQVLRTGKTNYYRYGFLNSDTYLKDMRKNIDFKNKNILTINVPEQYFDGYMAQKILVDAIAELPFYCALTEQRDDLLTKNVQIDNRPMLRCVEKLEASAVDSRVFYIPLDYWEL